MLRWRFVLCIETADYAISINAELQLWPERQGAGEESDRLGPAVGEREAPSADVPHRRSTVLNHILS